MLIFERQGKDKETDLFGWLTSEAPAADRTGQDWCQDLRIPWNSPMCMTDTPPQKPSKGVHLQEARQEARWDPHLDTDRM